MNKAWRIWKEFRSPRLKCGRIGCKTRVYSTHGYERTPTGHHYVAFSIKVKITKCVRCGKKCYEVVSRTGLDSLTLNRNKMDELEEIGWVII